MFKRHSSWTAYLTYQKIVYLRVETPEAPKQQKCSKRIIKKNDHCNNWRWFALMRDVKWWGDMLACECLLVSSQKPGPQLTDVLVQMVLSDCCDTWWSCWNLIVKTVISHLYVWKIITFKASNENWGKKYIWFMLKMNFFPPSFCSFGAKMSKFLILYQK